MSCRSALLGIIRLEQRPIRTSLDPAQQHVEIGLEPDRYAARPDQRPGLRIDEGAATACEYLRPAFEQARDNARFTGPEIGLAVGLEYLRDAHAGRRLDLDISVHERQVEIARQPAPDRRLAGAHHSHQNDRTGPQVGQRVAISDDCRVLTASLRHEDQRHIKPVGVQPALRPLLPGRCSHGPTVPVGTSAGPEGRRQAV